MSAPDFDRIAHDALPCRSGCLGEGAHDVGCPHNRRPAVRAALVDVYNAALEEAAASCEWLGKDRAKQGATGFAYAELMRSRKIVVPLKREA